MNAGEHPTSFGVFKPVGHVVIAFPPETDLQAVEAALTDAGSTGKLQTLSAAEMLAQADGDLASASPMAAIGQELNLVKAHRELALLGHNFVVVEAGVEAQVDRVAEVARRMGAARAQHYGRWLIEELIAPGTMEAQAPESTDTGLDAQTPSGREAG